MEFLQVQLTYIGFENGALIGGECLHFTSSEKEGRFTRHGAVADRGLLIAAVLGLQLQRLVHFINTAMHPDGDGLLRGAVVAQFAHRVTGSAEGGERRSCASVAVIVAGVIWGVDLLLLKPGRRARANAAAVELEQQLGAGGEPADTVAAAVADTRERTMREPLLVEYAHAFFPVLFVVWALRSFLLEPFTIPSGSMLPTLEVGDYILVNKFAYGLRLPVLGLQVVPVGAPQRGDVMVFKFPGDPGVNYIKRVIGIPGDRIRFHNGQLYINGKLQPTRLVAQNPEIDPWEMYFEEALGSVRHTIRHEAGRNTDGAGWELEVPAGHYFMMGDNRDNSKDSRLWCDGQTGPHPGATVECSHALSLLKLAARD